MSKLKSKRKKQIELKLGLWSLRFFRALFSILPLKTAVAFGASVGDLFYKVSKRHRIVAMRNLHHAFPDWTRTKRDEVTRSVFRNFGRSTAEFLKASSLSIKKVQEIVEIENKHYFEEALSKGKGVLLITAHFGNWELMARLVTSLGYPLKVVARDADDPTTNQIVNELRAKGGYEVLPRGGAARQLLAALKRNELVAILPDQNAADVFVQFFNQPCGSVAGPAVLHLRTGAPILPVFGVRIKDGMHRVEIKEPINYQSTGDTEHDVHAIMSKVQGVIEEEIRCYPDQWLWIHDRWKAARQRGKELTHAR